MHRVSLGLTKLRLSFPHLFVPRAAVEGGAEKFSASLWLDTSIPEDKAQLAAITDALKEVAKADFKGKKPGKVSMVKGSEKYPDDPDLANIVILNCYNQSRPVVVDHRRQPIEGGPDGQSDLLYPGCYVNANVTAYGYRPAGGGIAFGLEGVQWVGNGERLDSRKSAEAMFEEEEVEGVSITDDEPVEEAEDDEYDW